MIRRVFTIGALAATALAAPTAAVAGYPAPQDALSCNAAQATPGSQLSCEVGGPNGAQAQVQVTSSGDNAAIAGTVTSQAKTIDGAPASFEITLPSEAGTVGISALLDGVAVDTTTVAVAEQSSGSGDALPSTGFESTGLAIGAGGLLLVGAGAVVVGARRRAHRQG